MTETPQQEALRLAKEAGFVIEDDNDTAPAFHACTTAELVCLIALARASQAQPEPPAGWVMVPKELTVEMLRAVLPGEGTYSAAWWGELLRKSWKAMLAAAPSPKGEGMNIEQLADMLEKNCHDESGNACRLSVPRQ